MQTPLSFQSTRRVGLLAALGALVSGCSSARVLDALVPIDTYRALFNQSYGGDPRQRLDVFLPLQAAEPSPVVVFFYGGSWTNGDRADYRFVGEALAAQGIVAVLADYRLSPNVRYPVFLQDCALAVRWAHDRLATWGGDPRRLMVMGHSAGAYNSAMLALDSRWLGGVGMQPRQLAGWIGIAGPYDFLPIGAPDVQRAFDWPCTPRDSQPLFHAVRGAPRCLLVAASQDTVVNPQRNTLGLANKLREASVPVQVELLDGVNHVTVLAAMARPLRFLAPVLDKVVAFAAA